MKVNGLQKYKPLESAQPRNEPGTPNVQRFTLKTFKKCGLEPKVSNFFWEQTFLACSFETSWQKLSYNISLESPVIYIFFEPKVQGDDMAFKDIFSWSKYP